MNKETNKTKQSADVPVRPSHLLARKIVEALFVNGLGERAERLKLIELRQGEEFSLGGWCYGAAVDRIEDVITLHLLTSLTPPPQIENTSSKK